MESELLKKDEILGRIVKRRQRSIFKRFLENPMKAMDESPSVFYALLALFAAIIAAFLLYSGVKPTQVAIFSVLLAVMPAGFYDLRKRGMVKVMEAEFPSLLRDIALAVKSGLTLDSAVMLTSSGQYGRLTKAIRHVDYLMSWGVGFEEALLSLSRHYPAPLIRRSVSTIIEASKTGGEIGDILDNVATDAQELKELGAKRAAETQPYIMVIYVSFFVFLAVILVISQFFIPQMQEVSQQIEGKDIPGLAFRVTKEDVALYQELFFHALVVQGFFAGIVAGKMGSGSMMAGLKHSAVFVTLAVIAYVVLF